MFDSLAIAVVDALYRTQLKKKDICAFFVSCRYGIILYGIETAILTINRIINGRSINTRIVRGFIIFAQLPFFHQIFGVGINNLESYVKANGIMTLFDESNLNYSATIGQTLDYSGIVGLSALLIYFFHLAKRTRSLIKKGRIEISMFESGSMVAMLFLVVFILGYESVMFTYRFAFLIIIFESLQRQFENGIRRESTNEDIADRHGY